MSQGQSVRRGEAMTCPHCQSSIVTTDKEYLWYCVKCNRYELRPIEPVLPMDDSMKENIQSAYMVKAVCSCGRTFRKRNTTPRQNCPYCQNIELQRKRNARKKGTYERKVA